ncbi:MAG: hypothetical protein ABIG61_03060 [Planctomycetota bacterium]
MQKSLFFISIVLLYFNVGLTRAVDFLFDFQGSPDTNPGVTEPGYTEINPITPLYNASQGYGFWSLGTEAGGRARGGTDLRLKDFMYIEGIEPVFQIDLPNGTYAVDVWVGDMDYARTVRMEISTDYGSNWTLYGCDTDAPLPGTYMTDFIDSGTPGSFLLTIPDGKSHYYANYIMAATEFLQVHDEIEVTQNSILFRIGSPDRIFNCIEVVEPADPNQTQPEEYLFDFEGNPNGANPGEPTPGYTSIYEDTAYSETQGYGFLDMTDIVARLRGGNDSLMKDFVSLDGGETNVFRANVENGEYELNIFGGDLDYDNYERFMVSLDGGSSWTTYGADYADESSPCPPLPGTYYAAAGGTITIRGLDIPVGKPHSYANYLMSAGEMLHAKDVITVTQGYILIKSGATWAKINAVEIVEPTVLTCEDIIRSGSSFEADINADCYVNLLDLVEMTVQWLDCTNPDDLECD